MFQRLLVANRGEIAVRIMRTCKRLGIETVLLVSKADEDASYTQQASQKIVVGPASPSLSYLNQDAILKAASDTECQAIHPGYGFLAENPLFAARCEQQKLTFVGPASWHMRLMGDKATARHTMAKQGVPVLPGTETLFSLGEAKQQADQIGYPVLLKATAGGGGKGMRLVPNAQSLEPLFVQAQNEAQKAFSNPGLYLEKYIADARHIELQVLGDGQGNMRHLGERECSIQRNHQKLLEESPAFGIERNTWVQIIQQTLRALHAIGYQSAGTVEFLLDPEGNWYFIEMNTRIQVEHPVTEMVTGIDLIEWQIRIALGQPLPWKQEDIHIEGHAIECRINAEDPKAHFMPSPGQITRLEIPKNPSHATLRVDTHLKSGDRIPSFYDSLIAKVVLHAKTRKDAIAALQQVLAHMHIDGVATTLSLHQAMVAEPQFLAGGYTCSFLAQHPNLVSPWQK